MTLKFDHHYFALFAGTLLVEIGIALWVHDRWVRPYGGDALVVVLIYAAVRAVVRIAPERLIPGVLGFSCLVELGQACSLVTRLGVGDSPFFQTLFGTHFDGGDFVVYLVGAVGVLAGERARTRGRPRA